ncbi:MAG: hypothetical protein AB7S83_02090 [Candidatus Methanomethylophilaceae archaeon]
MTEETTLKQDLRHGSWGRGILAGVLSFLSIVVVPLAIIWFIEGTMASMEAGDGMAEIFNTLKETIRRFMIYGIPVIALAFLTSFYIKGNKAKVLFTVIALSYSIVWLFLVFPGGELPISLDTSGFFSESEFSLDNIALTLDFLGIMLLLVMIMLLKMVLSYAAYKSNREKYLEKLSE